MPLLAAIPLPPCPYTISAAHSAVRPPAPASARPRGALTRPRVHSGVDDGSCPQSTHEPPGHQTTFACPYCDYQMTPGICPECGRESAAGRSRPSTLGSAVLGALIVGITPVWVSLLELVCGRALYRAMTWSYTPGDQRFNDAASTVADIVRWSHLLLLPLLFLAIALVLVRRSCLLTRRGAPLRVIAFAVISVGLGVLTWSLGAVFVLMLAFSPD